MLARTSGREIRDGESGEEVPSPDKRTDSRKCSEGENGYLVCDLDKLLPSRTL